MVLCESYMFEFSIEKGIKIHASHEREVALGKIAVRLCLTLIIKELKYSVK